MIRSLLLLSAFVSFIGLGLGASAPFVCGLGYVWVDLARPQTIAYFILNSVPVSQIAGAATFVGYCLFDRRDPPRINLTIVLTVVFALWMTLSTALWAELPDAAWEKWNWAFKGVAFSAFLPFLYRSRVQIEAFLQVLLFSLLTNIIAPGVKTMISGGGYGKTLGFGDDNSLFAEGATLATVSLLLIPILLFLRKHALLVPRKGWVRLGYAALLPVMMAAAIGTYERTGLIGMVVLGLRLWVQSRRKLLLGGVLVGVALVMAATVSQRWTERISTVETYQADTSAMTRIAVWQWTLDYVKSHPLGGGFNVYLNNTIVIPPGPGHPEEIVDHGRAFHSIYFEVLGEQGWPGLVLFISIIGSAFWTLRRVRSACRSDPQLAWCFDLAGALQISLSVFLACGAFIGVGFQPTLYYIIAACVCLGEYVRRYRARDNALLTSRQRAPRQKGGYLRPEPGRRLPGGATANSRLAWGDRRWAARNG